jgi:5-(carboxyamino)imidazole ribonucleotide mutase
VQKKPHSSIILLGHKLLRCEMVLLDRFHRQLGIANYYCSPHLAYQVLSLHLYKSASDKHFISRGTLMNHRPWHNIMDVTILLGSKSDMPVAEKCTKILEHFGVSYQLRVASAHRSPAFVEQIIHDAEADGCTVFIAMAGLAAALPGAVAALTTKPVIGVPCGGRVPFDSLLSIVQLPPGVPAATVGVDRGDNAGYLATQILALGNETYAAALKQNKLDQVAKVKQMDAEVNGRDA